MRILIIDDEEDILDLLKFTFHNKYPDMDILVARDGKTALEIIDEEYKKHSSLDLIVSDIKLPDISGLEIGRIVLNKYPNIPIILFTAYDTADVISHASSFGIKTIIPKSKGFKRVVDEIAYIAIGNGD